MIASPSYTAPRAADQMPAHHTVQLSSFVPISASIRAGLCDFIWRAGYYRHFAAVVRRLVVVMKCASEASRWCTYATLPYAAYCAAFLCCFPDLSVSNTHEIAFGKKEIVHYCIIMSQYDLSEPSSLVVVWLGNVYIPDTAKKMVSLMHVFAVLHAQSTPYICMYNTAATMKMNSFEFRGPLIDCHLLHNVRDDEKFVVHQPSVLECRVVSGHRICTLSSQAVSHTAIFTKIPHECAVERLTTKRTHKRDIHEDYEPHSKLTTDADVYHDSSGSPRVLGVWRSDLGIHGTTNNKAGSICVYTVSLARHKTPVTVTNMRRCPRVPRRYSTWQLSYARDNTARLPLAVRSAERLPCVKVPAPGVSLLPVSSLHPAGSKPEVKRTLPATSQSRRFVEFLENRFEPDERLAGMRSQRSGPATVRRYVIRIIARHWTESQRSRCPSPNCAEDRTGRNNTPSHRDTENVNTICTTPADTAHETTHDLDGMVASIADKKPPAETSEAKVPSTNEEAVDRQIYPVRETATECAINLGTANVTRLIGNAASKRTYNMHAMRSIPGRAGIVTSDNVTSPLFNYATAQGGYTCWRRCSFKRYDGPVASALPAERLNAALRLYDEHRRDLHKYGDDTNGYYVQQSVHCERRFGVDTRNALVYAVAVLHCQVGRSNAAGYSEMIRRKVAPRRATHNYGDGAANTQSSNTTNNNSIREVQEPAGWRLLCRTSPWSDTNERVNAGAYGTNLWTFYCGPNADARADTTARSGGPVRTGFRPVPELLIAARESVSRSCSNVSTDGIHLNTSISPRLSGPAYDVLSEYCAEHAPFSYVEDAGRSVLHYEAPIALLYELPLLDRVKASCRIGWYCCVSCNCLMSPPAAIQVAPQRTFDSSQNYGPVGELCAHKLVPTTARSTENMPDRTNHSATGVVATSICRADAAIIHIVRSAGGKVNVAKCALQTPCIVMQTQQLHNGAGKHAYRPESLRDAMSSMPRGAWSVTCNTVTWPYFSTATDTRGYTCWSRLAYNGICGPAALVPLAMKCSSDALSIVNDSENRKQHSGPRLGWIGTPLTAMRMRVNAHAHATGGARDCIPFNCGVPMYGLLVTYQHISPTSVNSTAHFASYETVLADNAGPYSNDHFAIILQPGCDMPMAFAGFSSEINSDNVEASAQLANTRHLLSTTGKSVTNLQFAGNNSSAPPPTTRMSTLQTTELSARNDGSCVRTRTAYAHATVLPGVSGTSLARIGEFSMHAGAQYRHVATCPPAMPSKVLVLSDMWLGNRGTTPACTSPARVGELSREDGAQYGRAAACPPAMKINSLVDMMNSLVDMDTLATNIHALPCEINALSADAKMPVSNANASTARIGKLDVTINMSLVNRGTMPAGATASAVVTTTSSTYSATHPPNAAVMSQVDPGSLSSETCKWPTGIGTMPCCSEVSTKVAAMSYAGATALSPSSTMMLRAGINTEYAKYAYYSTTVVNSDNGSPSHVMAVNNGGNSPARLQDKDICEEALSQPGVGLSTVVAGSDHHGSHERTPDDTLNVAALHGHAVACQMTTIESSIMTVICFIENIKPKILLCNLITKYFISVLTGWT